MQIECKEGTLPKCLCQPHLGQVDVFFEISFSKSAEFIGLVWQTQPALCRSTLEFVAEVCDGLPRPKNDPAVVRMEYQKCNYSK